MSPGLYNKQSQRGGMSCSVGGDFQREISLMKQCNPVNPVAFFGGLSPMREESATGFTGDLGSEMTGASKGE